MPEVELKISSKNLTKKALQEIQKDLDATAKKLVKAAEESEKFGKKGESAFAKLRRSVKGIKADYAALAVSAGMLSAGLGLMIKSVIGASVKFDSLKRSLASVAGSSKETARQLKQLEAVARLPGIGLEEAIRGSVNLQAVEMSAEMAARSLKAYGNALATVGSGKAELGGVILALTQMSAKGKVLSEEINQIAERVPQIRKAMMDAFGTATSEQIQKMGITTKQFMEGILTELEKLPSVAGGASNSLENLSDSVEKAKVMFGDVLLPTFIRIIGKVSELVEWISKLSDTQKEMIAWGAVSGAAISGLVAVIAGIGIAIPGVIAAVKALGVAITFLSAHPLILAATAIAALTAGIGYYIWSSKNARYSSEKFAEALDKVSQKTEKLKGINTLTDRLEELRAKTELTVEEQQELVDVQNELIKLAPRLLSKYDNEGNAIAKTTTEIKKYSAELQKAINLERKIAIERAERELPKVEEDLKTVQRQLRIFEGLQAQMEPRKRMGTAEALLKSFYSPELGRVLTTYDKYLEEWDRVNDKQKVLIEKRDKLRADLESSGMPSEGKPDLGKPRTFLIPDTKEADKVFQAWADMERARIALISDSYQREREEATLSNKIVIHNIEEQLKEKEIQTERASHLNQQLSFEKEKLDQKLADIDRRFAQERRERISKDILAEREAIQQGMEERRKAHEETNRLMSRDILIERQFYEMSVQAADDAARRKKEIAEQLSADELDLSIRMFQAKQENAERTEKMITEGAQKAIRERARFEASVEKAKRLITKLELDTSAIQPFAREIAALPFDFIRVLKQRHDLGKQLNEELISLEQEKNNRLQEIRSDDTLSVRERAREIERIEKESAERRADIERDLMERKKALFGDYLKNFAAGIARQIELILQRKAAEKITEFAIGKLGGAAALGAGGGATMAGGGGLAATVASVIPPLLFAYVGAKVLGFDNPVHDRLAQISGGNTAMLMGASFDDPYNDMKAKLRGTYAASRDLGRRSAEDMLKNFQAGFIQKSRGVIDETSMETHGDGADGGTPKRSLVGLHDAEGFDVSPSITPRVSPVYSTSATLSSADDKLSSVLERMEKRLNDSPQFQLIIDGKPLHAILKRIDDSAAFRERSY